MDAAFFGGVASRHWASDSRRFGTTNHNRLSSYNSPEAHDRPQLRPLEQTRYLLETSAQNPGITT